MIDGAAVPYHGRDWTGTIEYEGTWHPLHPEPVEFQVKSHLKSLVHGFSDKDHPDWHENYLKKLKEISPGVWEYHIVEPYLD